MEKKSALSGSAHPMLSPLPPDRAKKGKVVSAEEAVRIIRDGDTIATGGFVGIGFPEQIAIALESYFLEYQRPRDLDPGRTRHAGLVGRRRARDQRDRNRRPLGHVHPRTAL